MAKVKCCSITITVRLPIKYNRIINAEDNFRQPVFWQTPCCTFALRQRVCPPITTTALHDQIDLFAKTKSARINSIDLLRGFIMIIMALDHTRDFFHTTAWTDDPLDLSTTTPFLYFTRWITHLCAR